MKTPNKLIIICVLLSSVCLSAFSQSTAFTYQGRLDNSGSPAGGLYDFRFRLDADPLGNTILGTVLTNAVAVTNGLFTATIDFGPGFFNGSNYWLEVDVKTNNFANYTTLNPLQPIVPTLYAVFASTASNVSGTVSATQLTGAIANGNLPPGPTVSGVVTAGSFSGSGAGLSSVDAATLNGLTSAGFWQTNGNAGANPTNGAFLGTSDSLPLEFKVNGQRALRLEPNTNGAPNLIGGSANNYVAGGTVGAVIGGGGAANYGGVSYSNTVASDFGTIGGGLQNQIQPNANISTIGGGELNQIQPRSSSSTIGGGELNQIQTNANASTIGGGFFNQIQTDSLISTIGGGSQNHIMTNSQHSTISGGYQNQIQAGSGSTIGGGDENQIQANTYLSTIAGGYFNQIQPGSRYATIGGGYQNQIQSSNYDSTISGGHQNLIGANVNNSTIGGGTNNTVTGNFGTIGGGYQNFVSGDFNGVGDSATVAGGYQNRALGNNAAVGGGVVNVAQGDNSVIAGGQGNTNTAFDSTIGGGGYNLVTVSSSTIGGGIANAIRADSATIAGGYKNSIGTNASLATIGGGNLNLILTYGSESVIGGGGGNQILPYANDATIPGGYLNSATNFAFAAGKRAKAVTTGAFVWADSQDADFASTGSDQFLIRAQGGVGIGKTNPATALDVSGTVTATAFSGGGTALTSLNAGNLSSGIVPLPLLPAAVVTNNEAGIALNGSFSGTGAGLTSLNAANISSGTLADVRLSANVAVLAGSQTFNGAKTFSAEVAANGGVRINNTNLWFKGDSNHGLGWYGNGKPFAGVSNSIDGPVLFGFTGGALGTSQFGAEHIAVQWSATSVTVNGTFNNNSDRNAKEHFAAVSPAEILVKVSHLPLAEWSYKTDADTRHIGPMAQDFYSAFNVGTDEKHIAPIDEGGVALAAIQGLNQKFEAQAKAKDAEILQLKQGVAQLQAMVAQLAKSHSK